MLAALIVVGLLCFTALQFINQVRSAQYTEDVVKGSLFLLTERLNDEVYSLDELASRFDGRFSLEPIAEAQLNRYQQKRRLEQRPLITSSTSNQRISLRQALNTEQLLNVELNTFTEQQAQATIFMLFEDWQRSGLDIHTFIQKVQPYFGYALTVWPIQQLKLSAYDLARLDYGDALVHIQLEDKSVEALLKLPNSQEVLKLGPIYAFEPYAWLPLLVVFFIAVLLLGLSVYWVVNSFEQRLRKLERATSRLAQGHLSARVSIEGRDAMHRLAESFNAMAEHIQRLISIQREMIRAVSHELRTPVARIRFALQIIEDSAEDTFVLKQVAGIDADIEELDELIDEILTYARLEEGGPILEFQQINVAALAEQVVNETRCEPHINVFYAGESSDNCLAAEVEPRYIHRAIQNLVGNACRYANSQVKVTCSIGSDSCRVDIEDDGPGIPKEQWEKVFTAFARLDDSRTRRSGGYGLGLSIVKRIAYWHGGQTLVTNSEYLGGARFSIIWPRKQQ